MRIAAVPAEDPLEVIAESKLPAYGMDRNDRIVYWNEGAERILGWKPEEVLGKACYDVLAGRDVFGNVYCAQDCGAVKTATEGEDPRPFLLDVRKKGTGTVKIVVRTVALPETGPRFSCLMHFIEAEGESVEPILKALRDSVNDPRGGDARPGPVPAPASPISVSPLTAREREIVLLLSNGFAALNIAAKLNLSHATVRNHIQNVLRKLDVHSQVEAVALSFRRGWI
ncbi:MAG: LuxR C-terminal-related transcriptional regulator [Thermoanaerobaculia bacterium]|jgi:DNA-binding CsgD family transcriptional regulator